ncbi:MAG TPA: TonB-dependent receptor [Steroidobacteraceae bacterium]|nr:TonB-dependent receptor [Steroidobacteraceae bacterium]
MKNRHLTAACTATLLAVTHGASADANANADADDSSEIVVTATRSERNLTDLPVSASVVNSTTIQDTPAQSLDDVLRHVPGVNLPVQTGIQAHPTADNVSMRGLGGIHALVLVDGVPLNDPFFGYIQWGRVPLEWIDRVEIVRGGGSPLWGNLAMGGVINVVTRAPREDLVLVDAGGGGFGTYRSSAFGSYGLSPSNRIELTAEVNGTDGFMAVPGYARRPFDTPTSFTARNFGIRDRWRAAENLLLDFRFNYHRNDQELGTELNTNRQEIYGYVASATQSFANGSSLAGTAFYSASTFVTDNTTVNDSSLPLSAQIEHVDNIHTTPFHDLGGSLVWSRNGPWPLRSLTAGVDINDVKGSDRGAIFDATGTTRIRTDIGRGEQLFAGAFAQLSVVPLDRLEFLASGRYQYFEVLNGYDGNPGGVGNEPDQSHTKLSPRISARYALTERVAVRAAYYQAFRAPTLDNLYRGFAANGGIYYPNSSLKPETLDGGEAGIDIVTQRIRAQVTYYRTNVNNLITTATLDAAQLPAGFFYGGRLVNAAAARVQGVEGEMSWSLGRGFATTLGYTWAQSVYRSNPTDPASVGQQLTDVPRNSASAALSYESAGGWRVSTDARYISATAWANAEHTDPGFPYQASADPHFVIDLAASYPINGSLSLYAQAENLLDRRYIVNPGPYNPPEYGTPFELFFGVRLTVK